MTSYLFQMVSALYVLIVIWTSIVHIVAQDITKPAVFDEEVDVSIDARRSRQSTSTKAEAANKNQTLAVKILMKDFQPLFLIMYS
jgi:hypothetical protein